MLRSAEHEKVSKGQSVSFHRPFAPMPRASANQHRHVSLGDSNRAGLQQQSLLLQKRSQLSKDHSGELGPPEQMPKAHTRQLSVTLEHCAEVL
jgi:hypothetical protein